MSERLLRTGDLAVGRPMDSLITGGVGSCVVACLWDSEERVGGMAHMLLPFVDSTLEFGKVGMAPGSALPYLVALLEKRGSHLRNLVCKLAGAGNMFTKIPSPEPEEIGGAIFAETSKVLRDLRVPVVKTAVGGNLGRHVSFQLESGLVRIRYTNGGIEEI